MAKTEQELIAQNKKAYHDYDIVEHYEAGVVLKGTEVKALRAGKANLKDSYAAVRGGEVFMHNAHISPYSHASFENHDPTRTRKLLLHRQEIRRLTGKVQEKGLTLVPLKLYFKDGLAKVELALAKGRRLHDKRQVIKERDLAREAAQALKGARVGRG
ncbi:MAG: SsrA-binding protein SmpB [Deltaproteobacteria bacterium]|nr:SsrA-binding protein SmpB [Deltaproteobacteria bacterium]